MNCNLCPRECNIDRERHKGFCGSAGLKISRAGLHFHEEPCISGTKGSGTVFFSGCNLKCVFCQNYEISAQNSGIEIDEKMLEKIFLKINDSGAHNINLVTPGHFSDRIAAVLEKIRGRLNIPVVYNTNSYEKVDALKRLEGLVDIYLPDFKYADPVIAQKYSSAGDYFETAKSAVAEMRRQQAEDIFSGGLMVKGLLVRHLIMPGCAGDSLKVLDCLKSIDENLYISLMSQYFPSYKSKDCPEINRTLHEDEYETVVDYFFDTGLKNGFCQELESAAEGYVPDFDIEIEEMKLFIDNL